MESATQLQRSVRHAMWLRSPVLFALMLLSTTLLLVGCTDFENGLGRPSPTPVFDTTTIAGYRQATEARGNQINTALTALHAACKGGVVATCTKALADHDEAITEPEELIRTTPAPSACRRLSNGYIGLANNASTYRAVLQTALASADPGTITAADGGAWRIWLQSWGNNNVSIMTDPCK